MIYADVSFYEGEYLLGRKTVISTGFPFYSRQASQIIDQYTFGRLKDMKETDIPEEVRMCCCELAEAVFQREKQKKATGGKTSEKIGTYSVSFGSAAETENAVVREHHNIVMKWLANTGLCYRGVGC